MSIVFGWDIGGVNTKAACIAGGRVLSVRLRPFELQRDPGGLVPMLEALAGELAASCPPRSPCAARSVTHAVTMTAELSQMFRTKREGVHFVLDAVEAALPSARVRLYTVAGTFVDAAKARTLPLAVAAANWVATANLVARHHRNALLIDVGTTTTDIIPIAGGLVAAHGTTDPDRLACGELVYTGAVRTPVEAIASLVPYRDGRAGVAAEGFALAGDVHVWRGDLVPADYTVTPPDGRPASREFAGERLARAICADREMLSDGDLTAIAGAFAAAQVERITAAIARVLERHPTLRRAVVTGLGAFLGAAAARAAGLEVTPLSARLGEAGARCAPAAAVALLLEAEASLAVDVTSGGQPDDAWGTPATARPAVDVVIKLGGGVLAEASHFDAALTDAATLARERCALIVPGGGPFADVVRAVDARLSLSDTAAHWMAILAMDQYAQLIASRLADATLVDDLGGVALALERGQTPVLAPARWLREADPLPHSWQVTSDSIAAWVARQVGAPALVLIKPPGAADDLVDGYFQEAAGPDLRVTIVRAGIGQ